MPRVPYVDPDRLTPEQLRVYERIVAGKRGAVRGPFRVLLHSPGLAAGLEQAGAYLRFESVIPERVRELCIAIVAKRFHADVAWVTHGPRAHALGVPSELLDAIAAGGEGDFQDEADQAAVDFVRSVLAASPRLPQPAFDRALSIFGVQGVVELAGLAGYYSMISMVLNAFEVAPEAGAAPWREGKERADPQ